MQAPAPPAPHAPPKACGLAVGSLICGCLGFILAFITGIPAIVMGHMALGKIRRSNGTTGGSGMATTGLVLGYVTTLLTVVWFALAALATPAIFQALERADMARNVSNARQIGAAAIHYSMNHDGKFPPDLDTLVTTGDLPGLSMFNYKDGKTTLDWIYHTGHSDSDPYDTILLAAPVPTKDGKRVVLFVDGSSRPIPEAEYLRKSAGTPAAGP